ncbi:hypothetical protein [Cupriavidus sp. WS]|uniref:hypothetical protein n=1 Tax=Cupriavidus sp. WS TaxID=1312922 RepID=UPI001E5B7F52|nr:hypothetical protein [Cupriavidus sp. WS]
MKLPKKYEIWQAIAGDGSSQTGLLWEGQPSIEDEVSRGLWEGTPVLLVTFEADSYEEACQKYNDHFGWGKYHPM